MKDDKKQTNKVTKTGIGFSGLLTIAFIVLKLCGVINWSWWWVLSPIIISTGISLIILVMCLALVFVCTVLEAILK